MKTPLFGFKQCPLSFPNRLRRLARRNVARGTLALPVLLPLHALVQIPFTPSISDLHRPAPWACVSVGGK